MPRAQGLPNWLAIHPILVYQRPCKLWPLPSDVVQSHMPPGRPTKLYQCINADRSWTTDRHAKTVDVTAVDFAKLHGWRLLSASICYNYSSKSYPLHRHSNLRNHYVVRLINTWEERSSPIALAANTRRCNGVLRHLIYSQLVSIPLSIICVD